VKRFRGGLVFKARRLLYHSTLGLRVIKKKYRVAHHAEELRDHRHHPGERAGDPPHQPPDLLYGIRLAVGSLSKRRWASRVSSEVNGEVKRRRRACRRSPAPTTRSAPDPNSPELMWTTTLSSQVNLPHFINSRPLCASNLVTLRSKVRANETLEVHRVV